MNEKKILRGFSFDLKIYFTQFVKLKQNGIMIISAALTTCDPKGAYEKNEHFYRPDFLIRSVSAAVTFVSPKKSNLQYHKEVSGNIQRS